MTGSCPHVAAFAGEDEYLKLRFGAGVILNVLRDFTLEGGCDIKYLFF